MSQKENVYNTIKKEVSDTLHVKLLNLFKQLIFQREKNIYSNITKRSLHFSNKKKTHLNLPPSSIPFSFF